MLAKRKLSDVPNWWSDLWHSFRSFVIRNGLYLYVEQKIALRDPEYAAHRTVLDWLYVVMMQQWFEGGRLGLSDAARFLAQHYGLVQLKHELPDYRMFNFRVLKEHLSDAAAPWGQDPGEWTPDKQRPTLLDGFMFFPILESVAFSFTQALLVESLIEDGADLNRRIEGLCLWIESAMCEVNDAGTLYIFIKHKADPNKRCAASTFGNGTFGEELSCPLRIRDGDPNTPWTLYLNWLFQNWIAFEPPERKDEKRLRSVIEHAVELFLKAGADTTAKFRTRGKVVEVKTGTFR
jgi:hypothetical protein